MRSRRVKPAIRWRAAAFRYDHITAGIRQALVADLAEMWTETLGARLAMSPGSPVAALDALLKARQ